MSALHEFKEILLEARCVFWHRRMGHWLLVDCPNMFTQRLRPQHLCEKCERRWPHV
jgi:hypothetical protein